VSIGASSSPEIQNCILNKNKEAGIELLKTKTPKIIGNQINSCLMGLSVSDSEGMQLSGNSLKNNKIGFDISASDIRFYDHQISYTNTIDSRILLYLNGAHDRIIGPGTNPAMVILVNASDIQLSDLVLSKNSAGVILVIVRISPFRILPSWKMESAYDQNLEQKILPVPDFMPSETLLWILSANTEHFLLSSLYGQKVRPDLSSHATARVLTYCYD
jgi:parallel beta-helix repeat protein